MRTVGEPCWLGSGPTLEVEVGVVLGAGQREPGGGVAGLGPQVAAVGRACLQRVVRSPEK